MLRSRNERNSRMLAVRLGLDYASATNLPVGMPEPTVRPTRSVLLWLPSLTRHRPSIVGSATRRAKPRLRRISKNSYWSYPCRRRGREETDRPSSKPTMRDKLRPRWPILPACSSGERAAARAGVYHGVRDFRILPTFL